ncbi:hypothetical protein NW755_012318 [Fusarium falciforme]|uniref:Glutamine amidotransferase domain-containing protein n=1 Tax=Fusarium falciforme TaxID=195108 RepID=A0A9W8UTZ3_9HYPO|nr:hypothetical protein NW755_012318 [Fusarium falciforme]KAJ4244268.1 hypothetical protein NW757_010627 [Fusarium falciforme]
MAQYFNLVILESELPSQDILQDYGSYGDIVLHALRYTANPPIVHTSTLVVTKRSVLEQDPLPDVDETDGVLILGSKHSASDNDPWVPSLIRFIQQAYLMGKPLVGICYGHQMIARALGGKIARSPGGWELGVTDMDVNSTGRRVFGADKLVSTLASGS